MANTEQLKTVVEPELADLFLKGHTAQRLRPGRVLGMDCDLIAYSESDHILWFCEITTSGFLGKGDKDFHVGAVRKFCEGFAKFSLVRYHESQVRQIIRAKAPSIISTGLRCRFVVPKGSRFIRALGWRKQLLDMGIMDLEELELSPSSQALTEAILLQARGEQATAAVAAR